MPTPPDRELIKMLRCPLTGAELAWDGETLVAQVDGDAPRYPMLGGVPALTVDAAILPAGVDREHWRAVKR